MDKERTAYWFISVREADKALGKLMHYITSNHKDEEIKKHKLPKLSGHLSNHLLITNREFTTKEYGAILGG